MKTTKLQVEQICLGFKGCNFIIYIAIFFQKCAVYLGRVSIT